MSEHKDNQALEEYLKGDSDLSRRYRAESKAEPPAHLDAAIISAAKHALENDKAGASSTTSRWYVPLSLAAVLVISFSLVFRVYDQEEQQILSTQSEMKKEKPALMMEGQSEPVASSTVNMRDEASERIEFENDSASEMSAAPTAGADVSKDDSLSGIESGPPTPQSVESLSAPAERRMLKSMPQMMEDKATAGNTLQPQQWFEIINQLWFDGDKAGAVDATKRFLEAYPEYPRDELQKRLPQEMDFQNL